MLQVDIEKIIPVTEARDMFNKIVDEVEGTDNMYVLTKNGKPSAVLVGVNHLEKLTGTEGAKVMAKISDMASDSPESTQPVEPFVGTDSTPMPEVQEPVPAAPAETIPAPEAPLPQESVPATPTSSVPEPAPVEPAPVISDSNNTAAPLNTGAEENAVLPNLPPAEQPAIPEVSMPEPTPPVASDTPNDDATNTFIPPNTPAN
ncbi:MAG: type II toxin-antitoxin system prevent-host-death family antitoxin [Patescibacteria group bacterium]